MLNIFTTHHGMNLVGQGGKIIVFTLPFAITAILVHRAYPEIASLPTALNVIKPLGYIFLVPGVCLWLTAVIQLLTEFPKGKLITTGAYGLCRNPIYASFILFVLPGVMVLTLAWVYLLVAVALYAGVLIFIRKEEDQLFQAFGQEYRAYQANVQRIMPRVRNRR